jgi:hypothetical protein
MCKEILVILINWAEATERIVGKNGGPRRRRGTRGSLTQKVSNISCACVDV